MKFRRDEGFTLVELMVVVLIIGILVAIAIPVFNAAKASAQEKSCYANQRTIEGAAQTWQADAPGNDLADLAVSDLSPTYIKDEPACPTDDEAYTFGANTDGTLDLSGDVHDHY